MYTNNDPPTNSLERIVCTRERLFTIYIITSTLRSTTTYSSLKLSRSGLEGIILNLSIFANSRAVLISKYRVCLVLAGSDFFVCSEKWSLVVFICRSDRFTAGFGRCPELAQPSA